MVVYLVAKIFPLVKESVGVRKDLVDTQKATLEIKKLEKDEKQVTLASVDDVKAYDPKTQMLIAKIQATERRSAHQQIGLGPIILFSIFLGWLIEFLVVHFSR